MSESLVPGHLLLKITFMTTDLTTSPVSDNEDAADQRQEEDNSEHADEGPLPLVGKIAGTDDHRVEQHAHGKQVDPSDSFPSHTAESGMSRSTFATWQKRLRVSKQFRLRTWLPLPQRESDSCSASKQESRSELGRCCRL